MDQDEFPCTSAEDIDFVVASVLLSMVIAVFTFLGDDIARLLNSLMSL